MKIISMKQLRQKFDPIRKGLEHGETYLLMYRSKPLGVMRPYSPQTDATHLGTGEEKPLLPAAEPLHGLPSPKTVTFGSKFDADTKISTEKPLDRLGMKKAFI